MSVTSAYNGLKWRLARNAADQRGSRSIEMEDYDAADDKIDAMTNSELLIVLSMAEDDETN